MVGDAKSILKFDSVSLFHGKMEIAFRSIEVSFYFNQTIIHMLADSNMF